MNNKYVYHFTKYENFKNIIEGDNLRISSMKNMNDINESTIQYPKSLTYVDEKTNNDLKEKYLRRMGNDEEIYKEHIQAETEISELFKRLYSISFVEIDKEDDIEECDLLWAHYGDCYRGVAIRFNKENLNKLLDEQYYSKSAKGNIKYVTKDKLKVAITRTFEEFMVSKESEINVQEFFIKSNYFHKLKCWDYENEYRFLLYSHSYQDGVSYLELKNIKSAIDKIFIGVNGDFDKYSEILKVNNLHNIYIKRCYDIWGKESGKEIEDRIFELFRQIKK